jgi:Fe-S oxidoreductase
MCRHSCPVSNASGKETLIPQSKMDRLNQLRRGNLAWTERNTESLWACTGCRECTIYCDHRNEPGLVLLSGRATANARGVPHPNLKNYPDRFRNRDRRLASVVRESVDRERFDTATVGFWPGCDAIDKSLEDVHAALAVFDRIGANHVRMVDAGQTCGGYPLLAAGYPDMFRWHAEKVAAELKRYRTVVINCSACLHAMRVQYPAEGVTMTTEVLSISEFLAQSVSQLSAPPKKRSVYYHDPCYLARYSGVIEPPRRVLSQVANVVDFAWSKTDTECCGGGGLLPKTMPDVADAMARDRLRDVANRGGGTVVTSCASCAFMLKRNAPDRVEVHDLPGYLESVAREVDAPQSESRATATSDTEPDPGSSAI